MKPRLAFLALTLAVGLTACTGARSTTPTSPAADASSMSTAAPTVLPVVWPQFRGARASGVAEGHRLPATWNVPKNEGVRWRTRVPGLAHASPVVCGDRVFVATAVAEGDAAELKVGLYGAGDSAKDMVPHEYQLWCLSLEDGRTLWSRTAVKTVPKFPRHTKATHCDSTPVTDGRRVVAVFGSEGMYCYTVDGEPCWQVDLGELDVGPHNAMDLHWGYASSPVIADGMVIVQADVKKNPFLAAFDLETGKRVWRVARDDTTSWATPTVIDTKDGPQVVVNGCKHMGGYALADGKEIWRMAGGGGLPVPAPIEAGDLILLTSNHRPIDASHPRKPVFAVKRTARGTMPVPHPKKPGDQLAWCRSRVGNYIQTPIVYRGLAYFGAVNGVVSVLDFDGNVKGRHRLSQQRVGFSASPVAGDGKIYFTSEQGDVHVVKSDGPFAVAHTNPLGEVCMATPAIAAGIIVFRGQHHVIAVGDPASSAE